jgi:hypothetical protein
LIDFVIIAMKCYSFIMYHRKKMEVELL